MEIRERLMSSVSRREPPKWEISLGGQTIGWIRQHQIGRTGRPFFNAVGIFPGSEHHIDLQSSTDHEERLRVLVKFHRDPMAARQHLGTLPLDVQMKLGLRPLGG
jgi:hypothetical protein